MEGFLFIPLIFAVRRPFWSANLDFKTFCTILDPKQVTMHENESFRMIDEQIIGIFSIWRPSWTLS